MARTQSLTKDTAHTLLSDPQRRYLLDLLKQTGEGTVDKLALQIAAQEQDKHLENVSEDTHQRVTISLIHKHIPLLADHNIVDYDAEDNRIVLMDVFEELKPYLRDHKQSDNKSVLQKLIPSY